MTAIFDILTNVKAITIDTKVSVCCSRAKNKQLSSQCKYNGVNQDWLTTTISHRKRKKERTVDALALGGDEGRGKLR